MLHFNNLYNLLTNRLVYVNGESPTLSDDPLAGVDLAQKAPDEAKETAEKPAESKKDAKETAEEIERKTQEEVEKGKAEYNRTKFEHEVYKAKAEVEEKIESQFGGLMKDIQESSNPGEVEFHYNRALKTFENMKKEMDALKFIDEGVRSGTPPTDAEDRAFKKIVSNLVEKAKKMERDGHPEIGGLTFEQIIKIMIAARQVHYKRYNVEDFETAKLDKQKELKAVGEKMDSEVASLLGETPKGEGQKVEKVQEAKPMTEIDYAIAEYRNQLESGSVNSLALIMTNLKQLSDAYANALKGNPGDTQAEMVTAVMSILGDRTGGEVYSNITFLEKIANEVGIKPGDSSKVIGQKIFDQFKNVPKDKNKKAFMQSQFLNLFS